MFNFSPGGSRRLLMVPDRPGACRTIPVINTMSTRYCPEYAGMPLRDAPASDPAMCEGGFKGLSHRCPVPTHTFTLQPVLMADGGVVGTPTSREEEAGCWATRARCVSDWRSTTPRFVSIKLIMIIPIAQSKKTKPIRSINGIS